MRQHLKDAFYVVDPDLSGRLDFSALEGVVPKWTTFLSGENVPDIEIPKNQNRIIILWDLYPDVANKFFRLTQVVFAIKKKNSARLTLCVPYLPFGRMDQGIHFSEHLPTHLNAIGLDDILTLHPHSDSSLVQSISLSQGVEGFLNGLIHEGVSVVLPDAGAQRRLGDHVLSLDPICLSKTRLAQGGVKITGPAISKDHCVLVDDIFDSGDTFRAAAEFLKKQGVKTIDAFVVHGVFSKGASERLEESPIRTLYCMDTIRQSIENNKLKIIPVLQDCFNRAQLELKSRGSF